MLLIFQRFLVFLAAALVVGTGGLAHAVSGFVYTKEQQRPGFERCAHLFPGSKPLPMTVVPASFAPVGFCSNHFAVVYSPTSKTPMVVVEKLTRNNIKNAAQEARSNIFFADPRLYHHASAQPDDFNGKLWDRGHMAPAGNMPDQTSMVQSFALTNVVMQNPENNRGVWRKIESDTRKFVLRSGGDVYVFTGPLFDKPQKRRVWIPDRLFKLVYDEASGRSWAWVLENRAYQRLEKPVSYQRFQQMTGLTLLN